MTSKEFQLDSSISKVTEAMTLWQMERGIIEISKDTLAIPIRVNDQQKGYVFHGQGKLLIDAIVETEEGAIGKSVEKELNKPFLMLGDTEETQKHLTKASEEDFKEIGYGNQKGFVDRAEDLCDQFFRERSHSHKSFDENDGSKFAFQNENRKLDVLVAKGSKLVYRALGIVFVSNENRAVLKGPSEVVCTSHGKSVIIRK